MTPRIEKAEYVHPEVFWDLAHMDRVRYFMALHDLCHLSCQFQQDTQTGKVSEVLSNSALAWSRIFEWPWALENGELTGGEDVLDAGGGHAVFQYGLAYHSRTVRNVDTNENSLSAVKGMQERWKMGENITTQVGDLRNLPFPGGSFDRTFCISVLEHIPEWRKVLAELFRVTKPGGVVITTLDVNLRPESGREFYVDRESAEHLIIEYGGDVILWGTRSCNTMPDSSVLECLCLKFRV